MGKQGNSIRKESKGKSKAKSHGPAAGSVSALGQAAENLPGKSTEPAKITPVKGGGFPDGKKSSKK
jgi:hypothetical protein